MSAHWYVLHSNPTKEALLWEQLSLQGIESYYPGVRVHPVNAHARIVSFDGTPAGVPDTMIAAIRKCVDEINAVGGDLFHGLKPGETVTIMDGPFTGYDAIFDARLSAEDRLRTFLKLLNRQQFPLELSSRQIRRIDQ